jgi:hypothetical protein
MAGKISRNDPCPCGSGKKYKKCCINKDFEWHETDDGDIARSVQLPDAAREILEELRQSQIRKYGRLPERVFEGAPPLELVEHYTVEAMKKAGVEPALIHAYVKTGGLLVNARNERLVPDTDIEEWETAIDEYERQEGRKATRRRLSEADITSVIQYLPAKKETPGFIKRLPFPPEFSKSEWGEATVASIVEVPAFSDYFEQCLSEVVDSGRSETYLKMFSVMTSGQCAEGTPEQIRRVVAESMNRTFTADELEAGLETVFLNVQLGGAVQSAAAAFEFAGFIGNFVRAYAENAGFEEELSESLSKIDALALLAFAGAVNVEFGVLSDPWSK